MPRPPRLAPTQTLTCLTHRLVLVSVLLLVVTNPDVVSGKKPRPGNLRINHLPRTVPKPPKPEPFGLRPDLQSGPQLVGDVPKDWPEHWASTVGEGCTFAKCKAGPPYVYILTAHSNAVHKYTRMLWSAARAAGGLDGLTDCVCAVVADFPRLARPPDIRHALKMWPGESMIVPIDVPYFARGMALQLAMEEAVTTPHNESLLLTLDADMVLFPGVFERAFTFAHQGLTFWQSLTWSTAHSDEAVPGTWRPSDTGKIAVFRSDVHHGFPGWGTKWAGQDTDFVKKLREIGNMLPVQDPTPELWHMAHIRAWARMESGQEETLWYPAVGDNAYVASTVENRTMVIESVYMHQPPVPRRALECTQPKWCSKEPLWRQTPPAEYADHVLDE